MQTHSEFVHDLTEYLKEMAALENEQDRSISRI